MNELNVAFQKDKDITKHIASSKALQDEVLTSDTTKALNACTLAKCQANARKLMQAMLATKQYDCKKEKNNGV